MDSEIFDGERAAGPTVDMTDAIERDEGAHGSASLGLTQRRVRQERGVKNISALRLGVLELVGQRDLVDRLVEPVFVDAAVPVFLHLWREDIVLQRDLQALELHV